jgi:hypothetical protein
MGRILRYGASLLSAPTQDAILGLQLPLGEPESVKKGDPSPLWLMQVRLSR